MTTFKVEDCYVLAGELPRGGYGALVRILLNEPWGAAFFFRTEAHAETIAARFNSNISIVKFADYLSSDHPRNGATNGLLLTDELFEQYLATKNVDGFERFLFRVVL